MKNNTIRAATYLALSTAVISGTANFINKIAVSATPDPIFFTALKNSLVAVLLLGIILATGKRREIYSLSQPQWLKLLAIGIIGGSIPFALFFTGLAKTGALNAALIHKTLVLWIAIMAIPLLKEKISGIQWLGIGAIFGANLLVGGFIGFKYNAAELMILSATILWAIENIIAKTALKDISSTTVAAARMTIGSLILLSLSFFWRGANMAVLSQMTQEQWLWTLISAALLSGYVLTWYSALKRGPATYVAALLVPATLVTNVLSAIFITKSFSLTNLISAVLFILGIGLTVFAVKNATEKNLLATQPASQTI